MIDKLVIYEITPKELKLSKEDSRLLHAVSGLVDEAGELHALLTKKHFRGKQVTEGDILDELGDVLWQVVMTAKIMGIEIEDLAKLVDAKLSERRKS